MIKLENLDVYGFEAAIRGMRNPMNSWEKSDSCLNAGFDGGSVIVGDEDLKLMKKLVAAGSDHSKFMRMITVTVDITAPLYWWKEFDTYKVGTVRNSCSTMHKIHAKEFTLEDFSFENLSKRNAELLFDLILRLNEERDEYIRIKNQPMKEERERKGLMKQRWWQMIQLLPSSYNQRATVQLNYAVLQNMYHSRRNHKLNEWRLFCYWIEDVLPCSELITGGAENDKS